ncbi:hypothetical protein ACFL6M_00755 [Candidatus Eisenbacteria bacterium]|uniref:Uncharacterized protein n=1 Tax=Eiseniibacteriota bacterium TaxID=2212470 RepID=A0ABV6YIE7_UNCEI
MVIAGAGAGYLNSMGVTSGEGGGEEEEEPSVPEVICYAVE